MIKKNSSALCCSLKENQPIFVMILEYQKRNVGEIYSMQGWGDDLAAESTSCYSTVPSTLTGYLTTACNSGKSDVF